MRRRRAVIAALAAYAVLPACAGHRPPDAAPSPSGAAASASAPAPTAGAPRSGSASDASLSGSPAGTPSGFVTSGAPTPPAAPTGDDDGAPPPLCEYPHVRCAAEGTARAWWTFPYLAPGRAGDGAFFEVQGHDRFGPGDAPRNPPVVLGLVVGGDPRTRNESDLVVGGAIVVRVGYGKDPLLTATGAKRVTVRGHDAYVYDARSVRLGRDLRGVSWVTRDAAGHVFDWQVLDDPRRRSVDALVAVLDGLRDR